MITHYGVLQTMFTFLKQKAEEILGRNQEKYIEAEWNDLYTVTKSMLAICNNYDHLFITKEEMIPHREKCKSFLYISQFMLFNDHLIIQISFS